MTANTAGDMRGPCLVLDSHDRASFRECWVKVYDAAIRLEREIARRGHRWTTTADLSLVGVWLGSQSPKGWRAKDGDEAEDVFRTVARSTEHRLLSDKMPSFERMRVRLEFGTNSTVIPQIRISYSQRTKPAARRVTQYTVAAEIELYTPPDALWFPVVDAVRQRVFLQRRWGTWTDAELGQAWRALTSTVGAWD